MLLRLTALCAGLLLPLTACSSEEGDRATDPGPADTTSAAPSTTPAETSVACAYIADGQDPAKPVDPPSEQPTLSGQVPAVISLNAGDVPLTLDADAAPCTVNSFASLAEQGYFDDTNCHRLTTSGIFVLQCGDPTATGMGGPGYQFADELSGEETYGPGTLAMANAGPDTDGSQFFIVYRDTPLPPSYTVFGQLDPAGLKVIRSIASRGAADGAADGPPAKPVLITGVAVG